MKLVDVDLPKGIQFLKLRRMLLGVAWLTIALVVLLAVWCIAWPLYVDHRARECLESLRGELSADDYAEVKAQIVKRGRRAVPDLVELLKDQSCDNRWRAAACLGQLGPLAFDAVPDLIEAVDDPQHTTRQEACRALGRIGSRQAVPALLRAVHGDGMHAIGPAKTALKQLNAEAVAEAHSTVFMNRSPAEYTAIRLAWEEMAEGRKLGPDTRCVECHEKRGR